MSDRTADARAAATTLVGRLTDVARAFWTRGESAERAGAGERKTATHLPHGETRTSGLLRHQRVHIVDYEAGQGWILSKIANRLQEQSVRLGVTASLGPRPDTTAAINHHVCYWDYTATERGTGCGITTLMVTHIDTDAELQKLADQLQIADMGICMSSSEQRRLIGLGLPADRLCYINPGHDRAIAPRKLTVAITTRLYADGRKREGMLTELAERMSLTGFRLEIMGAGWESIVATLRDRGIEVAHHRRFDQRAYLRLLQYADYYLYLGLDEGSMGYLDALSAGVPTIVTPQGFHLDAPGGVTHPFTTIDDLERVFTAIHDERGRRVAAVAGWTFEENARRHLQLWRYLLAKRAGDDLAPELMSDLQSIGVTV